MADLNTNISSLATRIGQEVKTKEPKLPTGGTTSQFLRGDKTWQTPTVTVPEEVVISAGVTPPDSATELWLDTSAAPPLSTYPVSSVAGKTGAVSLVKADVGLTNVDNTSDANKPVSTAQATAINAKVTNTLGASALWVGPVGSLPATGTVGTLYVTY